MLEKLASTESAFNLLKNVLADKAIHSITKFTTLDYPHHLASIFWFAKCNMACPYCYNPQIVRDSGTISLQTALEFLQSRQGRLDSVVLSGGECTLYPNLEPFCEAIKALNYKIKIDTNGSHPELLAHLIMKKLVDYIALDYKAPLDQYETLTHYHHSERFEESLKILIQSDIPFEVRTTLHSDLLTPIDINTIIKDLHVKGYHGTYYLQNYLHVEPTLGETKMQQNQFNLSQLSPLIPIELRNF
ncbi:anaerobic ribonucleoside-triphosphate reductase activating protein [Sulfurospirillum diekertiae]|uniref:anaerobic ribonucleoside-triphosphate reductase activating protein n=1 Tax=Sulfurospirillum diekertiae TaxID=1854492 RepID=UPI001CF7B6AB|nr:anaerobic ribonucleoside-triphosphate reductase activating protein [Sulfurospirillum diekertiae]